MYMQIAQMSSSNVTVWSIESPPRHIGEQSTITVARIWAKRPPPSSRAISAHCSRASPIQEVAMTRSAPDWDALQGARRARRAQRQPTADG
jgi:hypothetical protein